MKKKETKPKYKNDPEVLSRCYDNAYRAGAIATLKYVYDTVNDDLLKAILEGQE
jgi:hypothetical protein